MSFSLREFNGFKILSVDQLILFPVSMTFLYIFTGFSYLKIILVCCFRSVVCRPPPLLINRYHPSQFHLCYSKMLGSKNLLCRVILNTPAAQRSASLLANHPARAVIAVRRHSVNIHGVTDKLTGEDTKVCISRFLLFIVHFFSILRP